MSDVDAIKRDREDFLRVVAAAGFTPEQVRRMSENPLDQTPFPTWQWDNLMPMPSPIDGLGMYLKHYVPAPFAIAIARIDGKRTPAGRYVNHSMNPNAEFVKLYNGDIALVSLRPIAGGFREEVTVDYRQALALSGIHIPPPCPNEK